MNGRVKIGRSVQKAQTIRRCSFAPWDRQIDSTRVMISGEGQGMESTMPWPPSICSGGVTPNWSLGTPTWTSNWIARLPRDELGKKAITRGTGFAADTRPGRICGISMDNLVCLAGGPRGWGWIATGHGAGLILRLTAWPRPLSLPDRD